MKYLISNLIILLIVGCTSIEGVKRTADAVTSDLPVWSGILKTDTSKTALRVEIQTKDNTFSGLCLLKRLDHEWKGSVINEFGVKAFDFTVNGEECRLLDVHPMLDKKYIKKTVEEDIHFLFEADNDKTPLYRKAERFEQDNTLIVNYGKKQIEKKPGGTVTLSNLKYGIRYRFREIATIDRDKLIL
jgi:hypothetical protein